MSPIEVWSRKEIGELSKEIFGGMRCRMRQLCDWHAWRGNTIRPPMMCFGSSSALGVVNQSPKGKPKIVFGLNEKTFSSDIWFHSQYLVASVNLFLTDESSTVQLPYVPEWNEFFARHMNIQYDRLRVEPERIGLVINATENDISIDGILTSDLVVKFFESAGFRSEISGGGLITRQLIARLGGLQGARVFKIPGVRRLLKTYGPRSSFPKRAALTIIGGKDPKNPTSDFSDHKQLYIEAREIGTDLTPSIVFSYLVEKGLLRIGVDLKCLSCNLTSWTPLDSLRQRNVCELCGNEYDATRQLVGESFHYRRSGVLGLERNAQGAIPVALLLQQLQTNLGSVFQRSFFAPSFDLMPIQDTNLPVCEVDFVIVTSGLYPEKTSIIVGECKDSGGAIDIRDVNNLRRVADAFSEERFAAYIAFVKLSPFTSEEVTLISALNGPYQQRVIMLTARELEPYHLYERTESEVGLKLRSSSPADLARATSTIYFAP